MHTHEHLPAAPWAAEPAELARALASDRETGLSAAEAARRLQQHGANELAVARFQGEHVARIALALKKGREA